MKIWLFYINLFNLFFVYYGSQNSNNNIPDETILSSSSSSSSSPSSSSSSTPNFASPSIENSPVLPQNSVSTGSKFRRNDVDLQFTEFEDVNTGMEIEINDPSATLNQKNINNLDSSTTTSSSSSTASSTTSSHSYSTTISSNHQHHQPAILFDPPILEYGRTPVCIPTITLFTLTNNINVEFDLLSILSDNTQFYPVVFQPQIVNPKESVQIQILYLPFYPQISKATLTISTSIGNFEYYTTTAQAYNSYHLHPFIGYRIASGIPFQQPISIYNPHDQPLHIREIYTTEEFLSLEGIVPSEYDENNYPLSNQWILESGIERNIIHLSMSSSIPGYYTGYVHIKTNLDNIVIPVELTVLDGGLHVTPQIINFGILTNIYDISIVNITLLNSGNKPIEILEILPATPDSNLQINLIVENKILNENSELPIAQLVYKASIASGKISNKIIIITNHSNPALAILEIPYDVSCVHGGIGYEFNQALFTLPVRNISNKHIVTPGSGFSPEVKMSKNKIPLEPNPQIINGYHVDLLDIRNLTLTNYFSITLQILHVQSVSCPDVVSLHSTQSSLLADSLQPYPPITVHFNKLIAQEMLRTKDSLPHQCWLDIHTNFSTVRLPLVVIDGNIDMKAIGEIVTQIDEKVMNQTKGKTKNAVNSDILSIRIPFISSSNPRPIEIQFTNINPVRIPISIHSSTHNITICWKSMDGTATDSHSYNVHDYFTGHLFHSNYQPSSSYLLNSIDNVCHRFFNTSGGQGQMNSSSTTSSSTSSSTSTTNSTYSIKSEQSVIATVFFERLEVGSNKTEIRFITPYQMKILNIYYTGLFGTLIHSYLPNQTTLTMGKYSEIDIYTYSTFQETIQIDFITSSSRLLPAIMHSPSHSPPHSDANSPSNSPSHSNSHVADNQPWKSNQTELGFLTAHIISPYLECLVPYSRLRKINLWGCTIVLLEEWLSSITSTFHPSSVYPSSSISQPISITDEEYGLYTKMLDILRPIEGDILSGHYDMAMQHIYDFRSKWLSFFPHGIPIPEFNLVFKSPVTSSPFTISNVHIQIPLSKSSFYSNFILTPITYRQVVFIYFVVMNPYDVPLEVQLLDHHLPMATFTEYNLEKFPHLDEKNNITTLDDEEFDQNTTREVYSFELPERLLPYSHIPNSLGGLRDLKKLMMTPQEVRTRQHIQKIETSLSSISSVDNFLESNEILDSNDDGFFLLKALITIPRYYMDGNDLLDHPSFSRYNPSMAHILPPRGKQLLGPIAFLPTADQESSPMERYHNLSLYLHNNYTGIEKIEVICPVSKIQITVTEVRVDVITTESPELEPLPTPSSTMMSKQEEGYKSLPGLITLSTSPINSYLAGSAKGGVGVGVGVGGLGYGTGYGFDGIQLSPYPSGQNTITIMANQELFTIQIYLNNTSRVQTVIDKILLNGKYDICQSDSLLTPDRNLFPIFPKPSPVILSSSHICQSLPLILSPSEVQPLNLTFHVNCLYFSDQFTLSFLSNIYSSSRSVYLLHCTVYLTMTAYLTNICRMHNFTIDSHFSYLLKIFGLLLLGVLSIQTHKLSIFLNKFITNDKKRPRSPEFRNKKIVPRSTPHTSVNVGVGVGAGVGAGLIDSFDFHDFSVDSNNGTTAASSSSVESFPYLRKGIHLQDIPPIIDPSNSHFETIDSLKSKRISTYYGPSPAKPLRSSSSSGSASFSAEEIHLENLEQNIRNPILISTSFDNNRQTENTLDIQAAAAPEISAAETSSAHDSFVLQKTESDVSEILFPLDSSPLPPPHNSVLPPPPPSSPSPPSFPSPPPLSLTSVLDSEGQSVLEPTSARTDSPPPNSPLQPPPVPLSPPRTSSSSSVPANLGISTNPTTNSKSKNSKTKRDKVKISKSKSIDETKSTSEELTTPPPLVTANDSNDLHDKSKLKNENSTSTTIEIPPASENETSSLSNKDNNTLDNSSIGNLVEDSQIGVLDYLGSEALRASVIESVSSGEIIIESHYSVEDSLTQILTMTPRENDEGEGGEASNNYPPNSFDTFETHEMWENVNNAPPSSSLLLLLSTSSSSTSTTEILSNSDSSNLHHRHTRNGLDKLLVSGIVDSDAAAQILKSDSTDSSDMMNPSTSYDDWQFGKSRNLGQVPTPPPGFAGALGTYEYFSYYQDPLTSPSQSSLQVPLDPSYLRSGESNISPSLGAIGENPTFATPPRNIHSSLTTSPSQHYPQFLSLPPVLSNSDDFMGGDAAAEWEAMLTMPFEDMRGQVNSLTQLGSTGQNPISNYREGTTQGSFQNPIGYASPPSSLSSSMSLSSTLHHQSQLISSRNPSMSNPPPLLPPSSPFQQQQQQQPLYRTSLPAFSYDGRVGRNGGVNGVNYNQQTQMQQLHQSQQQQQQQQQQQHYPSNDMYGYGNPSYSPIHSTSPNRSFQGEYQQRQYNPRRPPYDGTELNGNQMYEVDRRNPPFNPNTHPGGGGGGGGGGGVYRPGIYPPPQPAQPLMGYPSPYGAGLPPYQSYPYAQPQAHLHPQHQQQHQLQPPPDLYAPYQSMNHDHGSGGGVGGAVGAPGLSPGGGYYQSSQSNQYPMQRENNNRHNNNSSNNNQQ